MGPEFEPLTRKRVDLLPLKNQKSINDSITVSGNGDHGETHHYVQFYESDAFLVTRVADFVASAFKSDDGAVIIATREHRIAVERLLSQRGLAVAELTQAGRYFSLDARETLDRFLIADSPDGILFHREIGALLDKATDGRRRHVWAFGEMVALLSAEKNHDAAIKLEEMWNELSRSYQLSLLCGYPMRDLSDTAAGKAFRQICQAHSTVLPTENYLNSAKTDNERSEEIAILEQKANSLQTEISTRKQMEHRSRLLASIVQYSDDAIISKDLNGIITSWNEGAERIFGFKAEEIVGHSVLELIPTERQNEEPGILARLRRGERIDHYETVRQRKDGSQVDVSLTVSPLKDDTGKIVGASKIARDITSLKRANRIQQALYDLASTVNSAVALHDIYDAALHAVCRCQDTHRAAILLYDSEGAMRFRAWRSLSSDYRSAVEGHSPWPPDEQSPQPICVDDVQTANLDERIRDVVTREGIRSLAFLPITYEGRLLGKFMIYYDVPHHFTPEELQPAQTIVAQVAFAIERRRTGENLERMVNERTVSLREAIAQMEEFSYSISHDLRAPVRAMQCYAEVLMEDYGTELDQHAKKYLDRIIQSGVRMDRLIQDILTYSRLSRREIKLQPISLDKLTRDIVGQYLDIKPASAVDISIDGALMPVVGHEASLSQAISNLLNNAVKFTAPGTKPKVQVWTERRNGDVRLWVEDNGIGIKPEYQHRLFNVFERVHPEKNYEGTGIGLAIVRKAAERMGGKAGVESNGVDGSKFWIQLPAAEKS
jgi:PAS domain S-box-containing protein